jgi:hypothetical protein
MKAYRGVNIYIHIFLTTLVGVSGQLQAPAALKSPRYPLDRRLGWSKPFGNWFQLIVEWLRTIEEELEINRETVLRIFVGDLGKGKICARFVPHCLTNEQKALRLQACQEFIRSVDDDRSLLDSVWDLVIPIPWDKVGNGAPPNSPRYNKFPFQN